MVLVIGSSSSTLTDIHLNFYFNMTITTSTVFGSSITEFLDRQDFLLTVSHKSYNQVIELNQDYG